MEWKKGKASCTNRFLSVIVEINGKYYVTIVVYLSVRKQRGKNDTLLSTVFSHRERGKGKGKKYIAALFYRRNAAALIVKSS
jgi:hypothetical protein